MTRERKSGRPTEYSEEYFVTKIPEVMKMVIDEGGHDASLCVALQTTRETLYQYRKKYPAVENVYQEYRLQKAAFYEKWFSTKAASKGFNATSAIFLMKNIDPENWNHDKTTDAVRNQITIGNMQVNQNMSKEQLLEHIHSLVELPDMKQALDNKGLVIELDESDYTVKE